MTCSPVGLERHRGIIASSAAAPGATSRRTAANLSDKPDGILSHSARSAITGSILVARRAGNHDRTR